MFVHIVACFCFLLSVLEQPQPCEISPYASILYTWTDAKYDREGVCACAHVFFMTHKQFRLHLTRLREGFLITSNVSQHTPAKGCGPVNGQRWWLTASHSQWAWMVLKPCNKGISCIRSNNRLAAHEPIPSAFWPTCYWEMTCFLKLHHEAEMINGLKSDKRIWAGLLFPAYFNHVVMKWI